MKSEQEVKTLINQQPEERKVRNKKRAQPDNAEPTIKSPAKKKKKTSSSDDGEFPSPYKSNPQQYKLDLWGVLLRALAWRNSGHEFD